MRRWATTACCSCESARSWLPSLSLSLSAQSDWIGVRFVLRCRAWMCLADTGLLLYSWDTRGQAGANKPTARVQAHDAEVNAVAFAPHNEHILLTGSADKVGLRTVAAGAIRNVRKTDPLSRSLRLSRSGISATSSSSCTRSSRTRKKSFNSRGRRRTRPCLRRRRATDGSTSGTCPRSDSSRRRKTPRTDRPSSCLCTAGTRVGRPTLRGVRTSRGRCARRRRTTCCRSGLRAGACPILPHSLLPL